MSRDYTVGDADATTAVVAVPTAPLAGNVVKVPADADPADVPKAIIELVNSLPKAADLATVAPSDPASAAVVGVSTKAAREDHQHKRELPAPLGVDKGKPVVVNVTGSGYTLGSVPVDLATTAPADPAATAVVGVGTTSARADHQHKKELPASVAADKDKILTLDATGLAPVWKAVPKELPVSGAANANHILALDATGLIPQWEAVTTVTELKPSVPNEAALPTTGNTVGDIRVTLDDGNMHVWIAATVTPAVAAHWDKIGPAAANMTLATVAAKDPAAAAAIGVSTSAAREDHQHKAELPAHTATNKHQSLWLGLAGTPEWRAPSPTTAPVNVRFQAVAAAGSIVPYFIVNAMSTAAKVKITGLTLVPVESRQFFKAGGFIRLSNPMRGNPRTYRIIKDWPAAVWAAGAVVPDSAWGAHGPDEYFAWEDIEAACAEGGTTGPLWEYALPELPPHVAADAGKTLVVDAGGTGVGWANAGGGASVTNSPPRDAAPAAVVGTATSAARGDHQHKAELPAHTVADKGKALVVDTGGTSVKWDAPSGLLAMTPTSVSALNTLGQDNSRQANLVAVSTVEFGGAFTSSVSLNGVFTADYDYYRVLLNISGNEVYNAQYVYARLRHNGVDVTTGYHTETLEQCGTTVTGASNIGGDDTKWTVYKTGYDFGDQSACEIILARPSSFEKKAMLGRTVFRDQVSKAFTQWLFSGDLDNFAGCDGISFIINKGEMLGKVAIYGYKK